MFKLFLLLFPILVFSWEEYKTVDGIRIDKQYKENFDFVQFKAETTIPASINKIMKVVINPETYTSWLSDCIKAKDKNDNIYILMQPPWPLKKRQVIASLSIKNHPKKKEIVLSSIKQPSSTPDAIWFTYLHAKFTLYYIDETHTKVSLSLVGDPGGYPPAWIVNLMAWEIPYKSLRDLKIYLKETKGPSK